MTIKSEDFYDHTEGGRPSLRYATAFDPDATEVSAEEVLNRWEESNRGKIKIISIENIPSSHKHIKVWYEVIAALVVLFLITNQLSGGWLAYDLWSKIFGV